MLLDQLLETLIVEGRDVALGDAVSIESVVRTALFSSLTLRFCWPFALRLSFPFGKKSSAIAVATSSTMEKTISLSLGEPRLLCARRRRPCAAGSSRRRTRAGAYGCRSYGLRLFSGRSRSPW